jgi:hypothetical protein
MIALRRWLGRAAGHSVLPSSRSAVPRDRRQDRKPEPYRFCAIAMQAQRTLRRKKRDVHRKMIRIR